MTPATCDWASLRSHQSALDLLAHRPESLHLLAQARDLVVEPCCARLGDVARLAVGPIQCREVTADARLDLRQPGLDLRAPSERDETAGAVMGWSAKESADVLSPVHRFARARGPCRRGWRLPTQSCRTLWGQPGERQSVVCALRPCVPSRTSTAPTVEHTRLKPLSPPQRPDPAAQRSSDPVPLSFLESVTLCGVGAALRSTDEGS
jgi:hypothetical protein